MCLCKNLEMLGKSLCVRGIQGRLATHLIGGTKKEGMEAESADALEKLILLLRPRVPETDEKDYEAEDEDRRTRRGSHLRSDPPRRSPRPTPRLPPEQPSEEAESGETNTAFEDAIANEE